MSEIGSRLDPVVYTEKKRPICPTCLRELECKVTSRWVSWVCPRHGVQKVEKK